MSEREYELIVTVRIYGGVTADEAAKALCDYNGTFVLPGEREVEIVAAEPSGLGPKFVPPVVPRGGLGIL